jgi:hypothetical protein
MAHSEQSGAARLRQLGSGRTHAANGSWAKDGVVITVLPNKGQSYMALAPTVDPGQVIRVRHNKKWFWMKRVQTRQGDAGHSAAEWRVT